MLREYDSPAHSPHVERVAKEIILFSVVAAAICTVIVVML